MHLLPSRFGCLVFGGDGWLLSEFGFLRFSSVLAQVAVLVLFAAATPAGIVAV
jgi:hypothetical protein